MEIHIKAKLTKHTDYFERCKWVHISIKYKNKKSLFYQYSTYIELARNYDANTDRIILNDSEFIELCNKSIDEKILKEKIIEMVKQDIIKRKKIEKDTTEMDEFEKQLKKIKFDFKINI